MYPCLMNVDKQNVQAKQYPEGKTEGAKHDIYIYIPSLSPAIAPLFRRDGRHIDLQIKTVSLS